MQIAYQILLGVAVFIALVFTAIVFFTGKGDAMGGSVAGVRTTFKGKTSIDEKISRLTLIMGGSFMALMLVLDLIGSRLR